MGSYTVGSAIVSGPAGVDLTKTYDTPEWEVGTKVVFSDGKTFRYCRATAAKSQYSCYAVDDDFTVGNDAYFTAAFTTTAPTYLCAPQIAISAPSSGYTYRYFWAQTAGPFNGILLTAGTSTDTPLYLSSANGALCGVYASGNSVVVEAVKYTGASAVVGVSGYSTSGACYSNIEMYIANDFRDEYGFS